VVRQSRTFDSEGVADNGMEDAFNKVSKPFWALPGWNFG
jgi:hypothetical protein